MRLSPDFLAEAVGRLDGVFGEFCYPDLTKEKALADESLQVLDKKKRPVRDLNPCYRRERAMSWTGLDERVSEQFEKSAANEAAILLAE